MSNSLAVYTYIDGINDIPFPNNVEQLIISDFSYDAKRMGGAPLISGSAKHSICLDDLWTGKEVVFYNGEAFALKQTPSSSYSNEDTRYNHELMFVSERIILDNTYFYDAVTEYIEDDKYVSNSSNVVFFGDIQEFASRLNSSLKYSKVNYSVVVDDGILSEPKLVSFNDMFFSQVLQEIFNVYELPYYFVGRVIHIGFTENAITKTFKYGQDKELITISKTNANYKIVNRITGIGSTENIPYYYPNNSGRGEVEAIASTENISIKTEDINIIDQDLYKKNVKIDGKVSFIKTNKPASSYIYIDSEYKYLYANSVDIRPTVKENVIGEYKFIHLGGSYEYYGNVEMSYDGVSSITVNLFGSFKYAYSENFAGLFPKEMEVTAEYRVFDIYRRNSTDTGWDAITSNQETGTTIKIDLNKGTNKIKIAARYTRTVGGKTEYRFFIKKESKVGLDIVSTAEYNLWNYNDRNINLKDVGISINKEATIGDSFTQKRIGIDYITPSDNLMPPIYRESRGAERFYNAKNNTYISPETGEYYVFENEYVDGNPKEHKVSFDYIKPTIKEITNASGLRIDMFEAFAYDANDNDETDDDEKYIHPYFFGKLKKFDGDNGFNLFDHSIENGEMTISMTSGKCGACNFIIGVDSETQKNTVQVDSNGNLLRDEDGDVRCGRENKPAETPQDIQQNTQTNSVWVALRKDNATYNVLMPNASNSYKPDASSDTFVILNIDLPQAYITSAENKLKEEIIKYMATNNSDKFNFSITFSRIFFAENKEILSLVNENARLQIEYNNKLYELFVSSYSYKCSSNDVLPQISVELSDTLTIGKGTLQLSIDAVKQDIMSSVGSIDFLKLGLKYFIRKDVDDSALGHIVFNNGIYVTGSDRNIETIQEDIEDYIQESNGDYIQEYSETTHVEEAQTLGGLSNVNDIVDDPATEDVVLVKKLGSSEWTQERKSISEGITDAPSDNTIYGRLNKMWKAIPENPTKLPNPNPLILTGAVNATYDGSKSVTVNIPAGGGGGGIVVDDHLDLVSINPVQNKVITMNINEIMDEIFKLTFGTFNGGGTYEIGSTTIPIISWSLRRKGEEVIPSVALVNGSSNGVDINKKRYVSPNAISTNNSYNVVCKYDSQEISRSANYTFSFKKYWGVSPDQYLSNDDILKMSNTWASRTMGKTKFDCTGGKYIYYIIPSDIYGNGVDFWVNGFKNTDIFIMDYIVTSIYGFETIYKIMRLNNIQTGVLEVEFK